MRMISSVLAGIVLSIGLATSASAHYETVFHGSDWGWVDNVHYNVIAADIECDGNQVYTRYTARTTNGNLWTNRVTDWNGCAAGTQTADVYPWVVTRIQVCEQNVGCTAWHNH